MARVDPAWLLVVPAYLLGTFPTALVVGRRRGRDPTAEGSGNPGASNSTVRSWIINNATTGVVSGNPSGTANRLLNKRAL